VRGGDVVQFGGLDGMAFEGVGCIVLYDTRENQNIWIFMDIYESAACYYAIVGICRHAPTYAGLIKE
jgi:hypothetical protein